MIGTPASTSWSISSILVGVGMKSRSIWKPSRGPTSVTVTLLGMHASPSRSRRCCSRRGRSAHAIAYRPPVATSGQRKPERWLRRRQGPLPPSLLRFNDRATRPPAQAGRAAATLTDIPRKQPSFGRPANASDRVQSYPEAAQPNAQQCDRMRFEDELPAPLPACDSPARARAASCDHAGPGQWGARCGRLPRPPVVRQHRRHAGQQRRPRPPRDLGADSLLLGSGA